MFPFHSRHVFTTIFAITPKLALWYINHPLIHVKFFNTTSKAHSFTLSYLTDICGFSPQRAASVSKHVNFETRGQPDSVIEFFKNHGLTQTQVFTAIVTAPQFLVCDPEKTLKPKIEFFKSKGFSDSDITTIINSCPDMLRSSLHKQIIPAFDFFNNMFHSEDKFKKVILRFSGILYGLGSRSTLNIKLLREGGVPESNIIRFVEYFPLSLKVSPKRFKDVVDEIKELEFDPLRLQFVIALNAKIRLSKSTWARKEGIYRRWGWTDDDIRAAFRMQPLCMTVSDNKIEGIMDFVVNKLGCKSSAIARCPVVMSMSLEKRIIPRGSVILILWSKGLVSQLNLNAIYKCNEKIFLDKFICCHEKEADELLKLYNAKLALAG